MTTLYQNPDTYDIEVGKDGQLKTVSGKDAYALIISDALRTIQGEYIFDINLGIPYLQTVLGQKYGADEWIAYVQSRVLEFDFVNSITSFSYRYDNATKSILYDMTVLTDLGTLEINQ